MHELAIGQRVQVDAPGLAVHGLEGVVKCHFEQVFKVAFEDGSFGWLHRERLHPIYTGAEVVAAMVGRANPLPADPPSPWVTVLVDGVAVEAVNVLIDLVRYALADKPARPKTIEGVSHADSILPGDPRPHR